MHTEIISGFNNYIHDSLGNELKRKDNPSTHRIQQDLYVGDTYSISVEIDPSFDPSSYTIEWSRFLGKTFTEFNDRKSFSITFTNEHISETLSICCEIKTTRNWHKYSTYDDDQMFILCVLPRET